MIREYSLKTVTDQVISRNRDSLILNHIRVLQETEDIPARTDEKWLSFILGQILSNSVKYKRRKIPVSVSTPKGLPGDPPVCSGQRHRDLQG